MALSDSLSCSDSPVGAGGRPLPLLSDSGFVSRFGQQLRLAHGGCSHRVGRQGAPGPVGGSSGCGCTRGEESTSSAKPRLRPGTPRAALRAAATRQCFENRGGASGGASPGTTSPRGPRSPPSSKPQPRTSQQRLGDAHSPQGVASERPDSTVPPAGCHLVWIVQPGVPNRNSSRTKDVTTPKVCPMLCLEEETECCWAAL